MGCVNWRPCGKTEFRQTEIWNMITCKLVINKQKNICVGITGMVLVFLVECCQKDKMMYSAWQSGDRRLIKKSSIAFLSSVCPVPSCVVLWQPSSCTNFRHQFHAMDSSRSKRFFSVSKCPDWLKWPFQPPIRCCGRCFPWGLNSGGMKMTADLLVLRFSMVPYLHSP